MLSKLNVGIVIILGIIFGVFIWAAIAAAQASTVPVPWGQSIAECPDLSAPGVVSPNPLTLECIEPTPTNTPPAATETPTATPVPPTATPPPQPTATPTGVPTGLTEATFVINRQSPYDVYWSDVTIRFDAGNSIEVDVLDNLGNSIPFTRKNNYLVVSTKAIGVTFQYDDMAAPATAELRPLLNDKEWAWSVSFDDNGGFQKYVEHMNQYGYAGMAYLMTNSPTVGACNGCWDESRKDDSVDRLWTWDPNDWIRESHNGWSVGLHGKSCDWASVTAQDFLDTMDDIMVGNPGASPAGANVSLTAYPDFFITTMAAPCGNVNFQQELLEMRDHGMIANEGDGGWYGGYPGRPIRVLDGPTFGDGWKNPGYDAVELTVESLDVPLQRWWIFNMVAQQTMDQMDFAAANSNDNQHLWFNTFLHASDTMYAITDHAHTYDDTVWVAPFDRVLAHWLLWKHSSLTQH